MFKWQSCNGYWNKTNTDVQTRLYAHSGTGHRNRLYHKLILNYLKYNWLTIHKQVFSLILLHTSLKVSRPAQGRRRSEQGRETYISLPLWHILWHHAVVNWMTKATCIHCLISWQDIITLQELIHCFVSALSDYSVLKVLTLVTEVQVKVARKWLAPFHCFQMKRKTTINYVILGW